MRWFIDKILPTFLVGIILVISSDAGVGEQRQSSRTPMCPDRTLYAQVPLEMVEALMMSPFFSVQASKDKRSVTAQQFTDCLNKEPNAVSVDLNRDGHEEFIVSMVCPPLVADLPMAVMSRDGGQWAVLFTDYATDISPLIRSTKGYLDLRAATSGTEISEWCGVDYTFNGFVYIGGERRCRRSEAHKSEGACEY